MNDPLGPVRGRRLRTSSWVLYDLANTVYMASVTFLFTPYVIDSYGERTGIGIAHMASMLVAAALVPFLGALTDHTARTRGYLIATTLLCIVALAGFGLDLGLLWLLGCFFVANIAFNLALLCYNALLPSVAPLERAGRVGGMGVGIGYLGTIMVVAVMLPMTEVATTTKFQIAAGMFLVFALPCMLLVRDHRTPRPGSSAVAIRAAASSLRTTLRALPKHRALLWFLLANFCFVDVLNTAILYFADLTESLFADSAPDNLLIIAALMLNGLAMVFGISLGPWTDRRPLQVMAASGIALLLAMIGGTVFGGYSVTGFLLTLVTFGAFGLAGIWTAGRKLVLLLAPDGRTGEYFGLYGITMKLSMFGAVIYSVVADGYGTKTALLSQTPQLCLGLALLSMVRLPKRSASETA